MAVDLKEKIRDIPDFPKRGIVFKDIMPLLADAEALHETVERLAEFAEPILEASIAARDQLRETQAELATANEQVARVLDMAAPLESMAGRVERLTGRRSRDPDADA
jgi:hypothetical protein